MADTDSNDSIEIVLTNVVTKEEMEVAEERLSKMRTRLMLYEDSSSSTVTFLMSLLFNTESYISCVVPTAGTDGLSIVFNPHFIAQLTDRELTFLALHEVMHIALKHAFRRQERDQKLFNIAADSLINPQLVDAGYDMPKGGVNYLCNEQSEQDWSTEQAYQWLVANAPYSEVEVYDLSDEISEAIAKLEGKASEGEDDGDGDEGEDGEGDAKAGKGTVSIELSQEEKEQMVDERIVGADLQARIANKDYSLDGGSELARTIDELKNPLVDWREELAHIMSERVAGKEQYTWARPNRRLYGALDVYLPSTFDITVKDLYVYMDVSGSLDDATVTACFAEISGMIDILKPKATHVYPWHHDLCKRTTLSAEQPVTDIDISTTGGTDIRVVYKSIEKHQHDMEIAIILTDGYFERDVPYESTVPIVWVVYDNPSFTNANGRILTLENHRSSI